MVNQLELVLIFVAVIIGVLSAAYFYISTDVFMDLLKRQLRLVSVGTLIIAAGVLISAFISYESSQGVALALFGVPLTAYFYALYLIGSLLIALGARRFTKRPKPIASAV